MGGIEGAHNLDSIHVLTGKGCQDLGDFIDHKTIHAALYGIQKVMIKPLYFN